MPKTSGILCLQAKAKFNGGKIICPKNENIILQKFKLLTINVEM